MAILNGIISGLGSVFGGLLGLGAQSSANTANMELAKYAFDRNVDMWRLQNEYNSPSAQMERLRAAGLNPNLVYGSGSVAGNMSGSAPTFNAPRVQAVSNGNFVSDAVRNGLYTDAQLKSLNAQTGYTETQSDVAKARIAEVAAQTAETLQRTARSKFDLSLATELRQNSVDLANEQLNQVRSSTALNEIRADYQRAELALMPLKAKLTEAQYNQVVTATAQAKWDYDNEVAGRIPRGMDISTWIINQVIRVNAGLSSVFSKNFTADMLVAAIKNFILH